MRRSRAEMAAVGAVARAPGVGCGLLATALASVLAWSPAWGHGSVHEEIGVVSRRMDAGGAPASMYLHRGELHRVAGEWEEARADYDRAATLDPTLLEVDLCMAAWWLDQGRHDRALDAVDRFLARRTEHEGAYELRARIMRAAGRSRDAARDLGRAIALDPRPSPDLYLARAGALANCGDDGLAEALRGLDEGIARLGPLVSLESAAADLEVRRGSVAGALERRDRVAAIMEAATRDAAGTPIPAPQDAAGSPITAPRSSSAATQDAAGTPITGPRSQSAAPPQAIAVDPIVTRGPYLQIGTPSRVTVRWRTDQATVGRLRYGTALGNLTSYADDLMSTTEHQIAITGLAVDTRYYYSIGTSALVLEGDDAAHTLVTPPVAGTQKPTRLWIIGDSGTANTDAAAVRDAFAAFSATRPADLWLMLGDNAYGTGTDLEYQAAVFDMYENLLKTTVLWPTRGNHDVIHAGAGNDYYDIFSLPTTGEAGGLASGTEAYYSYDYGSIHFVCLDSEGSNRSVGGAMAVWLRADLAATPRDWVIAYWHHPPYTKGSHDSDNDLDSGGRMGEMRANVLPILDSAGVDVVLTGHSHSYERSCLLNGHYGSSGALTSAMQIDPGDGRWDGDGAYAKPTIGTGPGEGVVYAVAGSSGQTSGGSLDHPAMITSLNTLGSMVVDVQGTRMDARFLDAGGVVRDSFSIMKGVTSGVTPPVADIRGPRFTTIRPNPFVSAARIGYGLPAPGPVRLLILDPQGRRVRTLHDGPHGAGRYEAVWDGRDDRGRRQQGGVYFAVLEFGGWTGARKLVLTPG